MRKNLLKIEKIAIAEGGSSKTPHGFLGGLAKKPCRSTWGRGIKNVQNYVHMVYGCRLHSQFLPKASITYTAINFIVRTITNGRWIQRLTAKTTSKAMSMIMSRSCYHFFSRENFTRTSRASGFISSFSNNRGCVQWHRSCSCFMTVGNSKKS